MRPDKLKKNTMLLLLIATTTLTMSSACSRDEDDSTMRTNRNPIHTNTIDGVWVDLGLPSGLLWATHNIGATTPEGYGDYFAWGETITKSMYTWDTYAHCYNGNYSKLTRYCNDSDYGYNGFTDTLYTLLPCDDAASVIWGGDARIPKLEEWSELCDNCRIRRHLQNEVWGYQVIGANGNSIFLPAGGELDGNYDSGKGRFGCYWSSTLSGTLSAYTLSNNAVSTSQRYRGLLIRPVRSTH